jgi:DNA repair protein RecN (Recombination protein N)
LRLELRTGDPRQEDAELSAERSAVRHAARLAELSSEAGTALREDGLARAAAAVSAAADLDPRLVEQASRLAALESEVADVADEIRRYGDVLDSDPARLEALESRLAVLETIKRKYGGTLEAAIAERSRLESRLGATGDLDAALGAATKERDHRRSELEASASRLTKARTTAAKRMQSAVAAELTGLRLRRPVRDGAAAAPGDRACRRRVGGDDVLGQPGRADRAVGACGLGR